MFLKTFRRRLLQKKFDRPRVEIFVVVGEEGVYCPVIDLVYDADGRAVIKVDSTGFDQLRQADPEK